MGFLSFIVSVAGTATLGLVVGLTTDAVPKLSRLLVRRSASWLAPLERHKRRRAWLADLATMETKAEQLWWALGCCATGLTYGASRAVTDVEIAIAMKIFLSACAINNWAAVTPNRFYRKVYSGQMLRPIGFYGGLATGLIGEFAFRRVCSALVDRADCDRPPTKMISRQFWQLCTLQRKAKVRRFFADTKRGAAKGSCAE